jgi:hypothetical protein
VKVAAVLLLLSAGTLGIYAGAMLTEGFVLVPHWQSLPPAEFHAWYAANDARLYGFFGTVTEIAALLAIGAVLAAFITRHPGRWSALVAAASVSVCVATFFVYFADANARFLAASIPGESLSAELQRWASWHRMRMVMAVVALIAALLSLRPRG